MRVDLIQVPYHMGREATGPGKGPGAYIEGDVEWALAESGHVVRVKTAHRSQPYTDEIGAIVDIDCQVARLVREATEGGRFPLVLAGNCNSALGTLAGLSSDVGIIWFDTHGDYNTPGTTISGWFEGMPLAIATGQCYPEIWRQIGNRGFIAESSALLVGVRDLDPAERDLLQRSAVQVVPSERLRAAPIEAALLDPLTILQSRVREVYLHLDMDVLDPVDAPGVDYGVPGGLRVAQMEHIIAMIGRRFIVRAAALTTYNPDKDIDRQTLRTGLRLIRAVVEAAVRSRIAAPPITSF